MDFNRFLERHRGKKTTVCGVGVSNLPLIRLLRGAGMEVEARDKKDLSALGDAGRELERLGVKLISGERYLDDIDADFIYRSPGIRPDVDGFVRAIGRGAVLTSEMEAFFEVCPARIIAITGSEGKTTTSTLIAEMLEAEGKRVFLGGNIGTPLLDRVPDMTSDDYVVVELSSFQLMTMKRSAPTAVVTNVTPNHLDIHKGMEEYIAAKANVFKHQSGENCVVLNADNDITRSFADIAKGEVRWFSLEKKVENGAYFDGERLVSVENGVERGIVRADEIKIPGMHNVANYLTAICAVRGIVGDEAIAKVAREFGGVEHRIEFVREVNGVRYYNDSIASSPTRTIAGLKSFNQKVVLIAGGYDKHIPFEPLAVELPAHVGTLVLCGATADKIESAARAVEGCPPIVRADGFEQAVLAARDIASEGDIVLMSPACASFDQFKNFAERGEKFKNIVWEF